MLDGFCIVTRVGGTDLSGFFQEVVEFAGSIIDRFPFTSYEASFDVFGKRLLKLLHLFYVSSRGDKGIVTGIQLKSLCQVTWIDGWHRLAPNIEIDRLK